MRLNMVNLDDYNKSNSKSWADKLSNGNPDRKQYGNDSVIGWHSEESQDRYSSPYSEGYGQRNKHGIEVDDFANAENKIKMIDVNTASDDEARKRLPVMLNAYISSKCNANEHCRKSDFDGTAREALQRISFLQALQAIEHFATSVSSRIQKRPAYLMGILRGQEGHWDKSRAAAELEGGSVELLALPPRVLLQIAQLCLEGNCLPSDFTPEVCLALHHLNEQLCLKALHAFNSNKRIVAGCKGGVLNRARFFERLIQNVAEQNASLAPNSSGRNSTGSDENVNGHYFDQRPSQGGETHSPMSPKQDGKSSGKTGRALKRSVSVNVTMDEAGPHGQTSPNQNAWSSPLASSALGGAAQWPVGNTPPASPTRSMSLDNSHFQATWSQDGVQTEHGFQPQTSQDARSISSLSVQTGDSHTNALGSTSVPTTPRESHDSKVIGSPVQAVQRGWESPMSRRGSSQGSRSHQLMSQSVSNAQVSNWNGVETRAPDGKARIMHRSLSVSEGQDLWKQNDTDGDFGAPGKPFTSLFSPREQQRSSTPTSQTSSSPRELKQKQLQPENEEPDTVSENELVGSLDLGQIRALSAEERANILEQELVKQNKQLRAYAKGESNIVGELLQAKSRIRSLETQLAKLSTDYHNLSGCLRQETMMAIAQTFDRITQHRRVSAPNLALKESENQQHPLYK